MDWQDEYAYLKEAEKKVEQFRKELLHQDKRIDSMLIEEEKAQGEEYKAQCIAQRMVFLLALLSAEEEAWELKKCEEWLCQACRFLYKCTMPEEQTFSSLKDLLLLDPEIRVALFQLQNMDKNEVIQDAPLLLMKYFDILVLKIAK